MSDTLRKSAAMEPKRVPVPRTDNPSGQRSASSPERNAASSGHDSSGESRRSEPGPAESSRLKQDTIPLQDIKDMIKRIHLRFEKVKKDKKKESTRKTQQKKQKAKEAREAKEAKEMQKKLDEKRQGVTAIRAAFDTEVDEVKGSKFRAQLEVLLRVYLEQELAMLDVVMDKVLVPEPDEAARASVLQRLAKLRADLLQDPNMNRWPILKLLHMQRAGYIRVVTQAEQESAA